MCGVITIASGLAKPQKIAVDATNVYWVSNQAGEIMKAPIAGGTPTEVAGGQGA